MLDGGELLARALSRAGTTDVFALHGGHLEAFYQGCLRHGIRMTDPRHEAVAVNAADAYARLTREVGVCAVTAGPGFGNAYFGLMNAYLDASPVLVLVGAAPLGEAETNPLQGGVDQVAAATPVTKWAHRVTHTERIPELVAQAVRTAVSGRPGPVLLEVPVDVVFGRVDEARVRWSSAFGRNDPPAPSPRAVERALEVLEGAERPAILLGGGASFSDCGAELRSFVERARIPVFTNNKAYGLLPGDHPLNGGGVSNLAAVQAMSGAGPDALLVLGARFGLFTGGRGGSIIPRDARIVQVDVDGAEIGRLREIDVGVVADCRATLAALDARASEEEWPDRDAWIEQATAGRHAHEAAFAEAPPQTGGRLHPYHAARLVVDASGPETVFVLDGGEAAAWAQFFMAPSEGGAVLTHGYLGGLGIGPGFAIGAQRARPDARVVHITGDGALGFHIQELDTMVRHELPIVTAVLNNAVWGMSIHGQTAMYGGDGEAITRLADSGYERITEVFGGYGERVNEPSAVGPAMERAVEARVPACINLDVDAEVVHPVTTAMLGGGDREVTVPYYQNLDAR